MTPFPLSIPRSLLAVCGIAASLCLPLAGHASEPAKPSSASLFPKITALIGDAECDNPSQCHVVGVGAKACGGPSGHLAWSSRSTPDQRALLAAVQAHAAAEKDENQASGMSSDCRMVTAPATVCRPRAGDGRKTCQLGQGGMHGVD